MAEPLLELRALRKSFGALKATDDVSLSLVAGEIHALIGPNGAGKSTLISQIAGAIAPDSGSIRMGGRDITRLSVAKRARAGLGRTFQISSLAMEFTALGNVMLAVQARQGRTYRFFSPTRSDPTLIAPARAILAQLGLAGRENVQTAALSHGERRQLEIATALAMRPRLLLMDEPMAGLGLEAALALRDFLHPLRSQTAILLVEHDMDAVFALADRITVLVEGRVAASGTADQIRAAPEVRAAYLGDADPVVTP